MFAPDEQEALQSLLRIIGPAPWSFVDGVRLLTADWKAGQPALSAAAVPQISRLLKSSTVLAGLYHFCRNFYPEKFSAGEKYTPLQLAGMLDPLTLAGVFALTFLFKRGKRICNAEEWAYLEDSYHSNTTVAVRLGRLVPQIGVGQALLSEGLLHSGLACLLAQRKAAFQQYRRYLKREKRRFDPDFEKREWGCSSVQIAARLAVSSGFGKECAIALEEGLLGKENTKSAEAGAFRLYESCTHALQDFKTRKSSLLQQSPEVVPVLEKFYAEANEILSGQTVIHWMDKTSAEGAIDQLPGIIPYAAGSTAEPSATTSGSLPAETAQETFTTADGRVIEIRSRYSDLPENLRKEISEDEFKQLQHMPLEEIIAILGG